MRAASVTAAGWVLLPPALLSPGASFAIDSYRYLHVSIETPWLIFLFLLVAIFVPFILMLVLMWRRPLGRPGGGRGAEQAGAVKPPPRSE